MQWFMVGVDWPINVGGRPPHSPPAFIPVTFELGVLFAALSIFFGLFVLWGMPRLHHPVFEVEAFRSASVDGLWLSAAVERRGGRRHGRAACAGWARARSRSWRTPRDPPAGRAPASPPWRFLAGCPGLDPMQRQAKYKAYQSSEFHPDGLAMRAPPAGTVPFGSVGDPALQRGVGPDGKPLPLAPLAARPRSCWPRGRKKFDIHCAVCHGLVGDGQSQVALNMSLRKPPSLHLYRDVPDGYLYQVDHRRASGSCPATPPSSPPRSAGAWSATSGRCSSRSTPAPRRCRAETLQKLQGEAR